MSGYQGLINIDIASASGGTADSTKALQSATTTVNVSAATAPTSGQVLTATSSTAATWQTPAGGSSTQGTNLNLSATTQSTNKDTGALVVEGGVGVEKDVFVGGKVSTTGIVNIDDTTQSSSTLTGALIVDGGAGIAKNLYVGGNINATGTLSGSNVQGGALVLIDSVTVTGTNTATLTLDGVFSSTYDNYVIKVSATFSSATAASLRMRSSSTDDSGAVYDRVGQKIATTYAATDYFSGTGGNTHFLYSGDGTARDCCIIEMYNPNAVQETTLTSQARGDAQYATSCRIQNTTQYDGLSVYITSGYLQGTMRVYGVVNTGTAASATTLNVLDTTQSTSTNTGALIVSGGAGIAKDVYIGGDLVVGGSIQEVITNKTASYTAVAGDHVVYDLSAATVGATLTLPATPAAGDVVKVTLKSENASAAICVTPARNGSTIDGGTAAEFENYNILWRSGDTVTFRCIASGAWITESRQIANRFAMRAYSGTQRTGLSGWNTVILDTESYDHNANFNTSTYTYTFPISGRYALNCSVTHGATSAGEVYHCRLFDGTTAFFYSIMHSGASDTLTNQGATYWEFAAGDTIYLQAYRVSTFQYEAGERWVFMNIELVSRT